MPSFDIISEWALANLYLVGAAMGVVLLVVLLILVLRIRRGGDADGRSGGHEGGYPETDILGKTLPAPAEMDLLTPLGPEPDYTAGENDHATPRFASARAPIIDAAEHAYPPPAPAASTSVAGPAIAGPPIAGPSITRPPIAGPPYVPPSKPRGDHARDIVQDLIRGQGDVTRAELRRIELLRPENVLAVVAELEAGLQGRGSQSQRARLAKIRQHVELLQPGEAGLDDVGPEAVHEAPEPVIGEAAAIGPTLEPEVEQSAAEDVPGPDEGERVDEVDDLHGLTPAELGRRFSSTDDKALKLSIIDALEETPAHEAISVIQSCLDDTDPEVQVKVLEAAERLLAQL